MKQDTDSSPPTLAYARAVEPDLTPSRVWLRRGMAAIAIGFSGYYLVQWVLVMCSEWAPALTLLDRDMIRRHGINLALICTLVGGVMMARGRRSGGVVAFWSACVFFVLHCELWAEELAERGPAGFGGTTGWTQASQMISSLDYLLTPLCVIAVTSRPFRRLALWR